VKYEDVLARFMDEAIDYYEHRADELGAERMREIERLVLLSVIDNRWREHLYEMDYLEEGIGLRAVGQRDPLVEYQREGFDMFLKMQATVKEDFSRYMFHVQTVDESEQRPATRMRQERKQVAMAQVGPPPTAAEGGEAETEGVMEQSGGGSVAVQQAISDKIPRNAPCPCGSGKKYKMCHGRPGSPPLE
jgi:preprotein translocase subunit SecA